MRRGRKDCRAINEGQRERFADTEIDHRPCISRQPHQICGEQFVFRDTILELSGHGNTSQRFRRSWCTWTRQVSEQHRRSVRSQGTVMFEREPANMHLATQFGEGPEIGLWRGNSNLRLPIIGELQCDQDPFFARLIHSTTELAK